MEGRISRPLKSMEIYENKINSTDRLNMEALGFDGYMWDPEYSDSELRAAEASGESRGELCPSTPGETAESQTQADSWCTCDQCPIDATDKKCCWDYPDARLHPDLRCLADWVDFRQVCLQPAVLTLAFAQFMVYKRQRGKMPQQLSNR